MDNNLNALMNAANQKLDAQKKQEDAPEEDLYADMRQEMEQDEYDDIDIQRQQYNTQEEYNIQHEPDDYEDEEPLTEEDEKWMMFIENPIGTIARIIGLGSLEDDDDLDYGDDENDLSDPSNFDSDYITKQELINRNNNSKIIKEL